MRPKLTKNINIDDFKNYYWLSKELHTFCKDNNIPSSGSKKDLTNRIETFLLTGEIKQQTKQKKIKQQSKTQEELSLDTVITENHRCSQKVRSYFKEVINPQFHFSTYIQNYFKDNVGKTYRDAVDAWYEEEERKKDPSYKTNIGSQFEYNQFTRDFYLDPKNKGTNRKEVIEAWNEIKKLPGSNKYTRK